jgi:hypothetical protein
MKFFAYTCLLIPAAYLFSIGTTMSGNTYKATVTFWVTDSFTVEVGRVKFLDFMKVKWNSEQENDKRLAHEIMPDDNSIFWTSKAYNQNGTLEKWTGELYKKGLTLFRNRTTQAIETDIELRPYSGAGSSGKDVYIRNNFLFRIYEIIY